MRNPVLVGAAVAAAAVLVLAGGGIAYAATPPSASVKAAICANASVEGVSGAADVAASRAQRELDEAKTALPAVMAEQDRRAKVLADAQAAYDAAGVDAKPLLLPALNAAKAANEEGNKARAAADQRVKDAETRLAAAQLNQRNAVALEAQVAAFVGTRDFGAVKTELCTTPATPTPSPTPSATPTLSPLPSPAPTTGGFSQLGEDDVPVGGVETGSA